MPLRQFYRAVVVGTPVVYTLSSFYEGGVTIALTPGSGGTMKIQYQLTSSGAFREGPLGEVSVYTQDIVDAPVYALKIFALTADGVVEIVQA